jgi:hypothetical protein
MNMKNWSFTSIDEQRNGAVTTAPHDIDHILDENNCNNECNCTYKCNVMVLIASWKELSCEGGAFVEARNFSL